ncbi:FAD-dependent monooxygenase [Aeromicrobium wangtongii]|uniref:FAD-dependent monooxygenase n=1 Tax=Aeromicrobium wangtongii TaxID=2969247 RepID=UPI0020182B22|nr:FAD-dependent monooxygenase [Aeromicrobium wangtongii]
MTTTSQVVIVGGGPVGVGLALDLALRGVTSTIVERRPELSRIPKGQGLSQRTMEHMQRWGVAEDLRRARLLPPDHAIGQITAYGNLMSDFWHASPSRELLAPYYSQANVRLPQYQTEAVLRRRLEDLPGVQMLLGWQATSVEQDRHGVRVIAERDGVKQELEGAYVVGCDGGHSLVREQSDIARAGTDFDELVALVVFRSRELSQALSRFPDRSTYRVMRPDLEGYWEFFGRVDEDEEFFFHAPVPRGQDPAKVDFAALMHRAAGLDFACEIDHVGFWDLRVQVATEYRAGRAFIAGDAAHTHPPYGGFGLNNGLEDAVNLGWKLAAVLDGWGGEALLDSYSLERQPIFRDVGEDIIGGWIRDDRAFLEQHSPEADLPEFERLFEETTRGFGARLRGFEPHYDGSPVIAGPPGGVTSAHGTHTFVAQAGHHLPPQTLTSGASVIDSLGPGFTLLALDADETEILAFAAAMRRAGVPLTVVRDNVSGGREAYGSPLILVRPDQFVAWTGVQAPTDDLLRRLAGQDATA